jgi:hypothetical protein
MTSLLGNHNTIEIDSQSQLELQANSYSASGTVALWKNNNHGIEL